MSTKYEMETAHKSKNREENIISCRVSSRKIKADTFVNRIEHKKNRISVRGALFGYTEKTIFPFPFNVKGNGNIVFSV